jgi:tRNA A-37 threonylcarbamoyl transferase component Bud32
MLIGEYQVEGTIAKGGMGLVYRAIHPVISKRVAIKVLNKQFARDPGMVTRFVLEARSVNQIGHHNIVDIFSIGELDDGRNYLVMELLEGKALDRILADVDRFKPGEILPIYQQLCDALGAAHGKGFIHRDLKPENIFVLRRPPHPQIKIFDFGLAKLRGAAAAENTNVGTKVGQLLGTPEYMSPEQCRGATVDPRADIYAMGVMLYELLTGKRPFIAPAAVDVLTKQMHEQPVPPRRLAPIGKKVERVILKAMAKDPNDRHASAQDLLDDFMRSIPSPLPWTASIDETAEDFTARGEEQPPVQQVDAVKAKPPAADAPPVHDAALADVRARPPTTDEAQIKGHRRRRGGRRRSRDRDSRWRWFPMLVGALGTLALVALFALAYWLGRSEDRPSPSPIVVQSPDDPAESSPASLLIKVTPTGATVTVNNQLASGDSSAEGVLVPVPPETKATVVVAKPGYASSRKVIAAPRSGTLEVFVRLPRVSGAADSPNGAEPTVTAYDPGSDDEISALVVSFTPADATLVVDGMVRTGRSPVSVRNLAAGSHSFELRAPGYHPIVQPFTLSDKDTELHFAINMRRRTQSKVDVTSTPEGAAFSVNGRRLGRTPLRGIRLPTDRTYFFRLQLDGYQLWEKKVALSADEPAEITVELVRATSSDASPGR